MVQKATVVLTAIVGVLGIYWAWGQERLRDAEQTAARAQRFLEAVGIDDRVDLSSVEQRLGGRWGVENYVLKTEKGNSFTLDAVHGAVVFSNRAAEDLRMRREDTNERRFRSDEEVGGGGESP